MVERYLYKFMILLSVVGLVLATQAAQQNVMYVGDVVMFACILLLFIKWHGES